jgi:hypothetical protein
LSLQDALAWVGELSLRWKILAFATTVVVIELLFRHLAPKSRAYARWTRFFKGIGTVWTAVILALVYLLSVGPIGLVMRLAGHDPLDRSLAPEPSFWRSHEPNPLGAERAARHQF